MKGTIYKLTNRKNGKVYIGQTVQPLDRRIGSHKSHLNVNTHHNDLLQRVYNKHGWIFDIETLEECNVNEIDEREKYWITYYDSTDREKGYNFEDGGNELKKHHPETIQKFITNSRGKNNKLTVDDVKNIKLSIIEGESLTEVANRYGVTCDCIYRIKNLDNWEYVSPELNDILIKIDTSNTPKELTDEEKEECIKLIFSDKPLYKIAKKYGVAYNRFVSIFSTEINAKRNEIDLIKEKTIKMFFENKSVDEILTATKLSYPQYKRIVKGLIEKRRAKNIEYVGEQLKLGKTNRELAKELNVNRCTITVYKKEYEKISQYRDN